MVDFMISGKISKLFSVLLLSALTTPVFSSESEEFNDDMLLAQRSSSDNENKSENENKKTSRNERSARRKRDLLDQVTLVLNVHK